MAHRFRTGLSFLFHQLPWNEKWLHFLVVAWVLVQFISSAGMHVHPTTLSTAWSWIDKLHIFSGLGLVFCAGLFFIIVLRRRKLRDLYPWVRGDVVQIKADLQTLLSRQLPEAKSSGLAATIEGLGLIALLLAVCSGACWYLSQVWLSALSPSLLSLHKTVVGLIEVYFYGHFLFAVLHFVQYWRTER